jgi:hypothetical protein
MDPHLTFWFLDWTAFLAAAWRDLDRALSRNSDVNSGPARVAGALRVLAVSLSAIVLGACGGRGGVTDADAPRAAGEERAIGTRTGLAGVSVELPPGWHAGTRADGNVVDPLTRVVASSAPGELRQVPCQIARYAPRPTDVTLVIVEWQASEDARFGPRPGRFTQETVKLHPPPAIECFDGRGGSAQFVDHDRVFGAYLLVGNQAPDRLLKEAFGVLNTLQVRSRVEAARRLARNGVSIAVPIGWDGRILFRDAAGSLGVNFQVANFELPPNEGFEPPEELPPGQEDPIKAMSAGDVLIMVISDEPTGKPAPETITLDHLRFLPQGTPRVPHGHALAEGSFCYGAHCVRVEVDFGGPSEPALRSAVDGVLASLEVEAVARTAEQKSAGGERGDLGPRGCPRESWRGPWTACAEAGWVRRVVREAGYQVVGETGSALIAEGKGRSFYIWTTPARRRSATTADEAGTWRRLGVIEGVPVYGDADLWRFWQAQGLTFWVKEGPRGDSVVPSAAELAPLVEASKTGAPPTR